MSIQDAIKRRLASGRVPAEGSKEEEAMDVKGVEGTPAEERLDALARARAAKSKKK